MIKKIKMATVRLQERRSSKQKQLVDLTKSGEALEKAVGSRGMREKIEREFELLEDGMEKRVEKVEHALMRIK